MDFNFELFLFYAVLGTGFLGLLDLLFLAPKRKTNPAKKMPFVIEQVRSLFPVFLLVFCLRAFAFESFRIPSGSLKPTLLVGDLILVNKFDYGIRLPLSHKKIFAIHEPQRGDIVVFRVPPKEERDLIKRVIGLPGDQVSYRNKILYINGKKVSQKFEKYGVDQDNDSESWQVVQKQENLLGLEHGIYQTPERAGQDFEVLVPAGHYFMMGDNRDDSADSRSWGFLPEENIIGKASRIWMSYDSPQHPVRWNRIGKKIV